MPGRYGLGDFSKRTDAAVETLADENIQLDLGHVEPAAVFRGVDKLDAVAQSFGLVRRKCFIQGARLVGTQVVKNDSDLRNSRTISGYSYSEIAIIYTMKMADREDGISLPQLLAASLESRGIMWNWASEDYRSKKSFDITTNSVAISTIHSVKGLDFACVFLVGLDLLEPGGLWSDEQIRSLAYVGMTRARYYLSIPYVQKTWTIHYLTKCTGG